MSARAYRINTIEYEDNPTFNLWHNSELMTFLYKEGGVSPIENGILEIPTEALKKALLIPIALNLDPEQVKQIYIDVGIAELKKQDYIQYMVY